MKYRINTNTNQIIEDHNNLGKFFFSDEWREATQVEVDNHLLEEAKKIKLKDLSLNRFRIVEDSTFEYQNKNFSNAQNARIAILSFIGKLQDNDTLATYFTYPVKQKVELVKSDFEAMRDLIESKETLIREAEAILINQINSINLNESYVDENNNPITALEALEKIDISLNN